MQKVNKHNRLKSSVTGFAVVCCALLTGCADLAVDRDLDTGYFPLIGFIRAEADRLANANMEMQRTVVWNGTTEELYIAGHSEKDYWADELNIFEKAAIDRPALVGLYSIDTLFIDTDSLTRVSYWAEKEDLTTRYMHVYFAPNETIPTLIEIHEEQHNVLYSSIKDMSYQPGAGFSISGTQSIVFMDADSFQVVSVFK